MKSKNLLSGLAALACALMLHGCGGGSTKEESQQIDPPVVVPAGNIRVGAFNLENFGLTKSSDPQLLSMYATIIRQYDAIVLQEIEDISGEAQSKLLAAVNQQGGVIYAMALSPRLGRSNAKEQYGLIYRPDKVTLLSSTQLDDPEDEFEREPHVFRIQHGTDTFGLIALHAKPDAATAEINAAAFAYDAFRNASGEANAFVIGDLNADCDYATDAQLRATALCTDTRFSWLIPDEADTTTGSTDCAYDRIVVRGDIAKRLAVPAVYRYDSLIGAPASVLSDHYPVEFEVGDQGGDYSGLTCAGAGSAPLLTRGALFVPTPPPVIPTPTPTPTPGPSCCRVCSTGKACGDSCISRTKNCNIGVGCACNG